MTELVAGFAKLVGQNFAYYMQTYSFVLGRNSKASVVDLDIPSLGGRKNISRRHARVYYDFERRRFQMDIWGKHGCYVNGQLLLPENSPVELNSQDLLQIGETKFYFLLPVQRRVMNSSASQHGFVGSSANDTCFSAALKKKFSGSSESESNDSFGMQQRKFQKIADGEDAAHYKMVPFELNIARTVSNRRQPFAKEYRELFSTRKLQQLGAFSSTRPALS